MLEAITRRRPHAKAASCISFNTKWSDHAAGRDVFKIKPRSVEKEQGGEKRERWVRSGYGTWLLNFDCLVGPSGPPRAFLFICM